MLSRAVFPRESFGRLTVAECRIMIHGTAQRGSSPVPSQSPGSVRPSAVNIIILGSFPYPHGMAVTRHVQLLANGLRRNPQVSVRVIILRQSSRENVLTDSHQGVPYETVIGDSLRTKAVLTAPWLYVRAARMIRRAFQPEQRNLLLVYGPPSWENLPSVCYARHLGFKIIFCVVEDDNLALAVSGSIWHRFQTISARSATRTITRVADGIAVISSHLEAKFRRLTSGMVPIHHLPILVDMSCYPEKPQRFGTTVTLFYSGSFGQKDGLPVLLDAFDRLAQKHRAVRLVLTGKGTQEAMQPVLARIAASPFRHQICYLGCLDEDAYYAALNAADIPCMTRVNTGFANAGFPFKLGEFLASGKPTIASRISDVGRLLQDRQEAMLVKPGDSDEIASAVEYLMADEERASAIGRRGREKAGELFDYGKHGLGFLEFAGGL
jgi:glycosyltransferase involved in cell wall biosynthesis